MSALPNFTEHEGHDKLAPIQPGDVLVRGPVPFAQQWLEQARDELLAAPGAPDRPLRVLDVGCGRGDSVFWLLEHGWDAYGIDVDPRYLHLGHDYLRESGGDPDRLQYVEPGAAYPFPEHSFDVVLSDQVFEHVPDLDEVAERMAEMSRPGTRGLHIFPARRRPIEGHLHAPLVHWLPKGEPRRRALRPLMRAGLTARYFGDRPLDERVEIFARFSDDETFYRTLPEIRAVLGHHGMGADVVGPTNAKAAFHAPWLPAPLVPAAGWLYRHGFSVVLETRQR